MADVKISALPAAASLAGTEEVPLVQSATTKRTTAQDIADLGLTLPINNAVGPVIISDASASLIQNEDNVDVMIVDANDNIEIDGQHADTKLGRISFDGTTGFPIVATFQLGQEAGPQSAYYFDGFGNPIIDNGTVTWSWPAARGSAGTVLTDVAGDGVLSFQAGGGSLTAAAINAALVGETLSSQIYQTPLQVPQNPVATGGTAGSLAAGDYFFKIVATDGLGGFTTGSVEVSATIAGPDDGTGSVVVTWDAQGAALFRVYVGITPGGEDHYFEADPQLGPTYTLTALGGTAGTVPVANTAIAINLNDAGAARIPFNGAIKSYGANYGSDVNLISLTNSADAYYGQITIGDDSFGRIDFDPESQSALIPDSQYDIGSDAKPFGNIYCGSFSIDLNGLHFGDSYLSPQQWNFDAGEGSGTNISVIAGSGVATGFRFNTIYTDGGYNALYPAIDYGLDSSNRAMFWSPDLTGASDFPYFLWYDGKVANGAAVWRVNAQGVAAHYNPGFATDYTPGGVDFERIIQGQWNTNVAEIGAEAGGTGTLRALRLLGSGLDLNGLSASAGIAVASTHTVTISVAGTPYKFLVSNV